jgi:nucleotide-binding universal stress UspA family protein
MSSERVFEKILVPVDESVQSLNAQELAAVIAKKLKSGVTVLHVVTHELMNPEIKEFFVETDEYRPVGMIGAQGVPVEEGVPPALEGSKQEKLVEEFTEWAHEKGKEVITEAGALFKQEGISVDQKLVEHADPAETIIKEAEKGKYDLIVMGCSGEEEDQPPHLGSIAKKVSSHAKTPVLIVRGKKNISKMLVAVDGSKSAEKALQYAALLSKETKAQITLLYVQESNMIQFRPKVAKEIGTNILSKAASQVEELKPSKKLESGDPAEKIVEAARNGDCDLIVLGSKGHRAIGRFLLGGVSDHVVHSADRSVLIVR